MSTFRRRFRQRIRRPYISSKEFVNNPQKFRRTFRRHPLICSSEIASATPRRFRQKFRRHPPIFSSEISSAPPVNFVNERKQARSRRDGPARRASRPSRRDRTGTTGRQERQARQAESTPELDKQARQAGGTRNEQQPHGPCRATVIPSRNKLILKENMFPTNFANDRISFSRKFTL